MEEGGFRLVERGVEWISASVTGLTMLTGELEFVLVMLDGTGYSSYTDGAKEHGLPDEYIQTINSIGSVEDAREGAS